MYPLGSLVSNGKQHLKQSQRPSLTMYYYKKNKKLGVSYMCAHLWLGPMGGCTGIPETDFLKPLSLSASPLPPGSPSLGTELARLEPRWRSEWSSLRLRRILPCGSLMLLLRHSLLITFWDTASSKRCRCFLGMKILANMVACEENKGGDISFCPQELPQREEKSRKEDGSTSQMHLQSTRKTHRIPVK